MKVVILVFLTIVNLAWAFPLSKGDQYQRRLGQWYSLATRGRWEEASRLEKKLDVADTKWFKERNKTEELKKRLNQLTVKGDLTADDWMEVASIQSRLQKKSESKESIKKAYEKDPIRSDIEKIYFSSF